MPTDLSQYRTVVHQLRKPLLIISGQRGSLCCGYLNVHTLSKNGDAAAIVKGVNTLEDMLSAKVQAVTTAAKELGVESGMIGAEALRIFNQPD